MQDLEAKRLRESLVEYENYLNEIRQVTRKNVEALDVIQKYTDQSAAGMQNLAEQSIEGIQRVTTESAGGLRKIIETGTSNLSRMAEGSQDSINRTAQECRTTQKKDCCASTKHSRKIRKLQSRSVRLNRRSWSIWMRSSSS